METDSVVIPSEPRAISVQFGDSNSIPEQIRGRVKSYRRGMLFYPSVDRSVHSPELLQRVRSSPEAYSDEEYIGGESIASFSPSQAAVGEQRLQGVGYRITVRRSTHSNPNLTRREERKKGNSSRLLHVVLREKWPRRDERDRARSYMPSTSLSPRR